MHRRPRSPRMRGGPSAAGGVVIAIAFAASLGCQKKAVPRPLERASEIITVASAAVAPVGTDGGRAKDASSASAENACPPLDRAKVAAFAVDRSKIDTATPPIVDDTAAMSPFYERVAELARGRSSRHVRIAVYGDSNLTEDRLTGRMRRLLQERFGDGGHGFVALARPWAWYVHQDVHHHGTWPLFKQIAVTTDPVADHQYGMNHFAAESRTAGASVWVATADEDAKVGRTASRFDISYLKQRRGGSFDILLDDNIIRTVSTNAESFEPGYEVIEASDAAHSLKCVVKGDGPVRFFGTVLEREPSGIVVDSLGCGSLNFQRMTMVDSTLRADQLRRRQYDLIVIWLGMNSMWLDPNRQWIKDVVADLRAALPAASVLLTTPPDSVKEGERKSDPRIVALEKQIAEVAAETGVAFWDMRAAMGGERSFITFMQKRLASPDRHHLLAEGAELMGERLVSALWSGLDPYLATHPDAGCTRPSER